MLLLATRDRRWMAQCDALLQAEGIPSRWLRDERAMVLDVPASEAGRASIGLSALLGEDRLRAASRVVRPTGPLLLQPPFILGVGLSLLLLMFFALTGGSNEPTLWFLGGRLERSSFVAGEWWRAITAATLHADLAHVSGNACFIAVLGWGAAERHGSGVAAFGWLFTAVVGFLVSLVLTDVSLTVGASGGLFGLLGLAALHAFGGAGELALPRRHRLRTIGSGVLLLAFTAFSPGSNIAAHVGGFAAGGALALVLPQRATAAGWQLVAALTTAGAVWVGWSYVL